jgi:hypothetical protein
MSERKEFGKIKEATFGLGGYQDVQIGFWLVLGGESWGVHAGSGAWATEHTDSCKWTPESRLLEIGEQGMLLVETLNKANKRRVQDLVGVPVEVTFDGNALKSWRVLTEVL